MLRPGSIATRLDRHAEHVVAPTRHLTVDVTDPASQADGIAWWEALTATGGEGMVVKPQASIVRGRNGTTQPGIKCRGREYLRIIYGPDYTTEANLDRLAFEGQDTEDAFVNTEQRLTAHEALERLDAEGELSLSQ